MHPLGTLALGEGFRILEDGSRLFCWRAILERELAAFPRVRIVVSSDWRHVCDDATLVRCLGALGSRFAGIMALDTGRLRVEAILADAAQRRVERWLALDDDETVRVRSRSDPRFLWCAPASGLSRPAVQRRLRAWLAGREQGSGQEPAR
jgi:Swiss Army Knife RNA repair-like protein